MFMPNGACASVGRYEGVASAVGTPKLHAKEGTDMVEYIFGFLILLLAYNIIREIKKK